jgi:nucleoid DNA-binding protein
MNKHDLINIVAKQSGYPVVHVTKIVSHLFDIIKEEMYKEPILIKDFGTFTIKERKGRTIKHPGTGVKTQYPSRFKPVFIPSRINFKEGENNDTGKSN